RFLAEIKTTANLQHPHILSLFDSGEADGLVFYVMPYVEGESLRDRLTREKQLPVEDAVRIAREVADALEYAHGHGIVHRDIKPETILLHGGHAMVADFGIALAASRSEGGTRMTETGMSLGTPHYMAPEQAMGEREITPKADIYALGCVLYEMLTAEPPFTGATAQAIIARVMTEEPRSLTLQRKTIPPHVEAAVQCALQKLPADRFASAAQFAEALGKTDYARPATRAGTAASRAVARTTAGQRVLRGVPWLLAVAGIGTSAWLVTHQPRPVPPPAERFTLSFGRGAAATDATGSPIALSPDGSRIVYLGQDSAGARHLFLRGLDRVDPVPIPATVDAIQPFFSPDGQWLGFVQDNKLRKVALAGGAVVTICDASGAFYGASWGDGDVIVFSQAGRVRRVPAAGGQPTDVAVPDSSRREAYRFPELLPGGRAAVFTAITDSGPSLRAVTLRDSVVTPLGQRGMSPHYVDGGYLVYAEQDGTLFAVPFDARRLRLTGAPQPITDNVRLGPAQVAKLGIARTGSLAYLSGSAAQSELVLVDRDGRAQSLPAAPARYAGPRFSQDGRRIAVTIQDLGRRASGTFPGDVWVWDLGAHNFQRITFDTASSDAEWMPDGRRLVYGRQSAAGGIALYTIVTDGSGRPESLLTRPSPTFESSPTPDGHRLVFRESHPQTGRDIWIMPVDSPQAARALLVTPFDERNPAVSPDGRWLAYASNETGASEIYVRNLAEGSGRTRVSTGGGAEPRWARSGRELFFRSRDSVYVVPVTPGPEFRAGAPRALFGGRFTTSNVTNWDVAPDGQGFVMVRTPEAALEGTPLNVVLHWFDQLRSQRR
ncbi:MAG: protein kinase, partial [Gemmatimonadales bacterium]|nr:protein kinase [Gemmatimonadales bacterium]